MKIFRAESIIKIVIIYSTIVLAVLVPFIVSSPKVDPNAKVATKMMFSAIILWVLFIGLLMRRYREPIKLRIQKINISEKLKFILFATFLACIEEAITCLMTNLAPVLGGSWGVQGITNTTNYFHLIFLHSVVTFVPAFVVWAFLLERYAFNTSQVFLLYGLTGTVCEAVFVRPDAILAGYWILIYGLMVYLPAYSMRTPENRIAPRLQHYILAIFLPIILTLPIAFAAIAIDFSLQLPHIVQNAPLPK